MCVCVCVCVCACVRVLCVLCGCGCKCTHGSYFAYVCIKYIQLTVKCLCCQYAYTLQYASLQYNVFFWPIVYTSLSPKLFTVTITRWDCAVCRYMWACGWGQTIYGKCLLRAFPLFQPFCHFCCFRRFSLPLIKVTWQLQSSCTNNFS